MHVHVLQCMIQEVIFVSGVAFYMECYDVNASTSKTAEHHPNFFHRSELVATNCIVEMDDQCVIVDCIVVDKGTHLDQCRIHKCVAKMIGYCPDISFVIKWVFLFDTRIV